MLQVKREFSSFCLKRQIRSMLLALRAGKSWRIFFTQHSERASLV